MGLLTTKALADLGMTVVGGKAVRTAEVPAAAKARPAKRRGMMNSTEAAYAAHLDVMRAAGEVRAWAFESVRLRLADGAYYTPDFVVVFADGRTEVHEVKGHWREAARLRVKLAAALHPWRVVVVSREIGAGWTREMFEPAVPADRRP